MINALSQKSIIVTEAASGIGQAAARLFAGAGARLVLADTNATVGEALARELSEAGAPARFVRVDVADEADVRIMVETAIHAYGRLDGAFNNAGIGYANRPIHELELESWKRTIEVNLTGVYLCMKHEIAAMLTTAGGSIVNTGSAASVVALPLAPEYNAAKHGVLGLTRNAALDYGESRIRVNAVLPGSTETPLRERQRLSRPAGGQGGQDKSVPKRPALPKEIAHAALWLLSDAASYVTGSALTVDGGFTVA